MLKKGVTLVEVLVTLGIIGIVAILLMIPLFSEFREKEQIERLKKIYNTFSSALNASILENGTLDSWFFEESNGQNTKILVNNIQPYIKYANYCNTAYSSNSFCYKRRSIKYKDLKNNNFNSGLDNTCPSFHFADGSIAVVCAQKGDWWGGYCSSKYSDDYHNRCGIIFVDTNGYNGPNKDGFDYFAFAILYNKLVPIGRTDSNVILSFSRACLKKDAGFSIAGGACTAWVMANKNMDYLHCPDKLDWNKALSCNSESF